MSPEAMEFLRADPHLGPVVGRVGPLEFTPRRQPPWQSLVRAIVYQQLSGKAAGTIYGRFVALFGGEGFPEAGAVAAMDPERLRGAGLSRSKTVYIQGVAGAEARGSLPSLEGCEGMGDGEIIAALTGLKGVGRWTVEMFLIFNLGRPDVLPVDDLGVRRGFQQALGRRGMPTPGGVARHGRRWAPHRSAAALYLWRAADEPAP